MKKGTRIFWIIVVCIILPGVALMSCMWCMKIASVYITKQQSRRHPYYRSNSMATTQPVQNPVMATTTTTTVPTPETDLDIRLFAARVFEDSGTLPRPGRNSCAICHQDYQPEQRAWLVQGCQQHSFHAHCLEEWLEFNSGCPACWNSLISSPEMATARSSPTPQPTSSSLTNSTAMAMATTEQNPEMTTTRNTQTLYTAKLFEDSQWLPRPGENSCAICRDKYLAEERLGLVNGCQHSFHAHCLESWLKTSPTCPLCRNSLSSWFYSQTSDKFTYVFSFTILNTRVELPIIQMFFSSLLFLNQKMKRGQIKTIKHSSA